MNLPRSLKLRHLETFVEIARHGSVSRAAESLSLTQPAATRTLRELEQICGCDLVERDGRGIRITHRGEVFLRHAVGSLASARPGLTTLRTTIGVVCTVFVTLSVHYLLPIPADGARSGSTARCLRSAHHG